MVFTPQEIDYMKKEGWEQRDNGWETPARQVVIPKAIMMGILEKVHEGGHFGTEAMINMVKPLYWSKDMWPMAHAIAWKCLICQKVNKTRAKTTERGGRPLAVWPFQRVQVDFTELPERGGAEIFIGVQGSPHGVDRGFP